MSHYQINSKKMSFAFILDMLILKIRW